MSETSLSQKLDAVLAGFEFFSLDHISVPTRFVKAAYAICKAAEDRYDAQRTLAGLACNCDGGPQGDGLCETAHAPTCPAITDAYQSAIDAWTDADEALDAAVQEGK